MKDSAPKARLFVARDLKAGHLVTLDKDQSHYVVKVMRHQLGDKLALFNGRDGEWWGTLTDDAKNAVIIRMDSQYKVQTSEPDIWLCFAPIKFGKIDFLAQKATELGASKLQPVATKRTVVSRVKTERLAANAREAAEQSERLTVPEIGEIMRFDQLLDAWPKDRILLVADETGKGLPAYQLLPPLVNQKLGILIGPEGGFSPQELTRLDNLTFVQKLSLGPRILRADTAAFATLTCVQALCGDWRYGQPDFIYNKETHHA